MKESLISEFCVIACQAANTDHPYTTADVCELAHKVLVTLHPDTEHDVEDPEGVFRYIDASESLFNAYFDEIEGALKRMGLEFDNSSWKVKGVENAKLVQ